MKAFIYDFKAPGLMSFSESVRQPKESDLKAGEILVKVHAAALNPVDYKKPDLIPFASLFLGNTVAAQDYSGVVVASKSTDFSIGDEVFGTNSGGCLGEYLACTASKSAKKPAKLSHIEACSLVTISQTTLQAFAGGGHASPLTKGNRVLVLGASGGCGVAGIQIARQLVGKEGVVVGVCSTSNHPLISQLNVTNDLIDYTQGPEKLIESLKSHAPFDIIYDTVSSFDSRDTLPGGLSYVDALKPLLSKTGCHVAINGSVSQWLWSYIGWQSPQYHLLMQTPNGDDMRRIVKLVDEDALKAVVDSVHSFTSEGLSSAYSRLKSRRSKGKVVVDLTQQ